MLFTIKDNVFHDLGETLHPILMNFPKGDFIKFDIGAMSTEISMGSK
jgi:hypothetical protein